MRELFGWRTLVGWAALALPWSALSMWLGLGLEWSLVGVLVGACGGLLGMYWQANHYDEGMR